MKTKTNYRNICLIILLTVLLACTVFFAMLYTISASVAYADDVVYTDVLDDLSKSEQFDTSNYPVDESDYGLYLIQIAEGVDNSLYVYVYQPSATSRNFIASSINISTQINDSIDPINYDLIFCNSNDVFYKYKVSELSIAPDTVRYYEIYSIFRPYDDTIDDEKYDDNGNIVSEVPYDVGKQYEFGSINGNDYVNCVDIETIFVTEKFVGYVRYPTGGTFVTDQSMDSHFVAFNTDRPIDTLLEVKVAYTKQEVVNNRSYGQDHFSWGDIVSAEKELFCDNYSSATSNGMWFNPMSYSWKQIQTIDEFFAETNNTYEVYSGAILSQEIASTLTDSVKENLSNMKWVLRFDESYFEIVHLPASGTSMTKETRVQVGDVTILRLKFVTNGITYNLGAIDNKSTGSSEPSNIVETITGLSDVAKLFLILLGLIAICALLGPIIPYVIKAILWIVTLPFRILRSIFKFSKQKNKKNYTLQYSSSNQQHSSKKNNNYNNKKQKYRRG